MIKPLLWRRHTFLISKDLKYKLQAAVDFFVAYPILRHCRVRVLSIELGKGRDSFWVARQVARNILSLHQDVWPAVLFLFVGILSVCPYQVREIQ